MSSSRTTRSNGRAQPISTESPAPQTPSTPNLKRKKPLTSNLDESPSARRVKSKQKILAQPEDASDAADSPTRAPQNAPSQAPSPSAGDQSTEDEVIPAVLSFDIEKAKNHLSKVDPRFGKLLSKVKCRPYEELDTVEPFRTLATTIIGQQISWKAARSIKHKFIRLYDPSLSEAPPPPGEKEVDFFPSAKEVASSSAAALRNAGLSARKAEYIQDLASHFSDGRLSAQKLRTASDQEVYDLLIQVKGIGPWTVEMFSMFSLRRPDILPVGDLGVQKGLLRWVLASHSREEAAKVRIAPHRLPGNTEEEAGIAEATPAKELVAAPTEVEMEASSSLLPAPANPVNPPATPKKKLIKGKGTAARAPPPPSPFSSAVFAATADESATVKAVPLPEGLTVATMKSRLGGKKAKKGVYLTPEEMQILTEPWAPYRSLGVWYMWSIVDDTTT